jgi:uncharacterized protein (DUF924 family)
MARSDEILEFWFGDAPEERLQKWFSDQPEFDRQCRESFLVDYERAAKGLLDGWQESTANCLALVLLLDQLPRTIFRNTPRAYASDAKAREVARRAIARGFDRQLPPLQRVFFICRWSTARPWSIRRNRYGCSDSSLRKIPNVRSL